MDFVTTYMPALVELKPETVEDTRNRLEKFARVGWPDLDTSPNTVLGDLILTPQSYQMAAIETGMDRFMSDLDLGNVANNIIYNCDFVEQYLKNFATDQSMAQRASGMARLVFITSQDYVLDRSVKFSFGSSVFSIYLPNNGPFTIYRTGLDVPAGTNGTVLKDSGSGVFFADVPLLGHTGASTVNVGTAGLISEPINELGSITALVTFDPGTDEATLAKLAERTRETIYSASLNTRNGAIRYVKDICPFVEGIYAIRNGDREMLRDTRNAFGTSNGCMDLYVRSSSYAFLSGNSKYAFTETQNVKLTYNTTTELFEGDFPYVGQPYHIESVTNTGAQLPNLPYSILSTNPTGLGNIVAYSPKEKLRLEVSDIVDEITGDTIYQTYIDTDGSKYAYFTVTYQTDPMLQAIAATVENADYLPINTDLLVRGFVPVIIDKFEVVYTKTPGVVPLLDEATREIKEYMDKLGAPDMYSDAVIAKIMNEAGAKYVKEIRVRAHVQWSVAERIYNPSTQDYDLVPTGPEIRSSEGLRVTYPAPNVDTTGTDVACSPRNIRYYLMEGALTFNEVKDI